MKVIGGYFELELSICQEYHQNAICLNTARNAFEYILLANNYSKVYLPFFTCDVLLEPLQKHKIAYEFYNIDNQFEPLFDYDKVQLDEVFLYTNYFGLKDVFIEKLTTQFKRIIIDNAQSFFSMPIRGIDTFYSPRKFFGVPDGAYLFTDNLLDFKLGKDVSINRFSHLLKRIDVSAEYGYSDFVENDESLKSQSILEMSNLTRTLLNAIDYKSIANKRKINFSYLHKKLKTINKLELKINDNQVPMAYPFWSDNLDLKRILQESKIYCATYWPNVKDWVVLKSLEYQLVNEVVYLPLDQRYNEYDMQLIIEIINK